MVAFVAASTPVLNGSSSTAVVSITPTLPTGAVSGDRIYIVTAHTPPTDVLAVPTSWAQVDSQSLGTGTVGLATGPRRITVFKRDYDGVWTMPTVSTASDASPSIVGGALAYRPGAGETLAEVTTSGSDTSAATSFSVTGAATLAMTTGWEVFVVAADTNIGTSSGETLTATGATIGTVTERQDAEEQAAGNRVHLTTVTASVTAGTATAAPVYSATISVASTGGAIFVGISATAAPTVTKQLTPESNRARFRASLW